MPLIKLFVLPSLMRKGLFVNKIAHINNEYQYLDSNWVSEHAGGVQK